MHGRRPALHRTAAELPGALRAAAAGAGRGSGCAAAAVRRRWRDSHVRAKQRRLSRARPWHRGRAPERHRPARHNGGAGGGAGPRRGRGAVSHAAASGGGAGGQRGEPAHHPQGHHLRHCAWRRGCRSEVEGAAAMALLLSGLVAVRHAGGPRLVVSCAQAAGPWCQHSAEAAQCVGARGFSLSFTARRWRTCRSANGGSVRSIRGASAHVQYT